MRSLTEAEILQVSGGGFFDFLGDIFGEIGDALSDVARFAVDFGGFNGSFGYNGSGWDDFSVGGFGEAFGDAAGTLWAFPNTVIGAVIGFAGYGIDHIFGDGDASITFNGHLLFGNNPFVTGNAAITFGDTQIYGAGGESLRLHENGHSEQNEIFGPFFFPAYVLGGIFSAINGDNPFREGNPFESPYYEVPNPLLSNRLAYLK